MSPRTLIRSRRPLALGLVGIVAGTSLAACGSDSDSSDGAPAPSQTFSGAPFTVQINTAIDTTLADFAGTVAAVKAGARAINAAGGIQGREVVVKSCNTKVDPNQEVACARDTVKNKAVVTINSQILSRAGDYLAILDKAGIADLGADPIQPAFNQAANSYPTANSLGGLVSCTSPKMAELAGGKRVVSAYVDIPQSAPLADIIKRATEKQGLTYAGAIPFSPSATDFGPIVQKIDDLKADIVVMAAGVSQFASLFQEASLTGRKFSVCTAGNTNLAQVLAPLGKVADSMYLGLALPPLSSADDIPALKAYKKDMAAELKAGDKDADISGFKGAISQVQAWVGMKIIAQVGGAVQGEITPQSFRAQLQKTTFDGLGILPKIDFAKPQAFGDLTRIFNPYTSLQRWDSKLQNFRLVPDSQLNSASVMYGQ